MKERLDAQVVCTGLVLAVAVAVSAGIARAQTVDEIVAQNLKARGGIEKLKALNSTKITGDVEQHGRQDPPGDLGEASQPDAPRARRDAASARAQPRHRPASFRSREVVVAFDGNMVWQINPMMGEGPQQITGPQADMTKSQAADFDSVTARLQSKRPQDRLAGTEPIDGKPAYHLRIVTKNGLTQHYYLDVATGLEVRTSVIVEQGGMKAEAATDRPTIRRSTG